jgi:hypothetical protein
MADGQVGLFGEGFLRFIGDHRSLKGQWSNNHRINEEFHSPMRIVCKLGVNEFGQWSMVASIDWRKCGVFPRKNVAHQWMIE